MNLYKKTTLKPDDVDVLALNMRHNFNISPLAVVHTGGDGLCEIPETTSTLLLPGDHLVCFLPSHTSERYKEWFEETISILRNDVWLNCRIENGPKKRLMRRGGGGENKKRKAGEVPTRPDDARGGHKGPEDDAGSDIQILLGFALPLLCQSRGFVAATARVSFELCELAIAGDSGGTVDPHQKSPHSMGFELLHPGVNRVLRLDAVRAFGKGLLRSAGGRGAEPMRLTDWIGEFHNSPARRPDGAWDADLKKQENRGWSGDFSFASCCLVNSAQALRAPERRSRADRDRVVGVGGDGFQVRVPKSLTCSELRRIIRNRLPLKAGARVTVMKGSQKLSLSKTLAEEGLVQGEPTSLSYAYEARPTSRASLVAVCLGSPGQVEAVRKMKSQALNCGCGKPDLSHPAFKGGRFTWCKFYQSIMLNQDLRPFYMPFLELSVEQLAECPLGSLAMVLMDTSLKVANAKGAPPKLTEMPSFLRAREMLQMILGMGLSLVDVTTSGWMLFNQVSALRGILLRRGGLEAPSEGAAACLQTPATETLPGRMLQTMMDGANFVPVGTKALLQLLQAPPPGPACRVTVPAMQMLVSYGLLQHTAPEPQQTHVPGAPLDSKEEGEVLLRSAEVQLRTALLEDSGSLKVLGLMLLSPWPIPEVLDLLSMPGRVNLTVQEAMLELLNLTQGHPLWDAAVANPVSGRYSFRVNPYREMVSDMVRYTRLPFCGLRPFMRMVASIAQAAVEAGCPKKGVYLEDLSLCEFTFIEGGPHLGDCALWAASALRLVGVRVRAIAYEPLPDAAGLFQQSVLENGFGGAVEVKMAALGAQRGPVEMIHFRGHNGQATVNGQDFPSHDPREVVKVPTEELALDE
ncbi:unnamed protein product, partial [Durusdinium trenchii]